MKKIGILGGTFDPIHIGHLVAADQALFFAGLDEIWFMPAPNPPHKMDTKITAINHRLEMVKMVVEMDRRYKLCTIEFDRLGPSYTLDTMKELKMKYSDYEFFLIIGGDMIKYLPKWYGIEELITIVNFIGLDRPGYEYQATSSRDKDILEQVKLIPMPQLDISSSQIREWVKAGRAIRYLVPINVERYIRENKLYES